MHEFLKMLLSICSALESPHLTFNMSRKIDRECGEQCEFVDLFIWQKGFKRTLYTRRWEGFLEQLLVDYSSPESTDGSCL